MKSKMPNIQLQSRPCAGYGPDQMKTHVHLWHSSLPGAQSLHQPPSSHYRAQRPFQHQLQLHRLDHNTTNSNSDMHWLMHQIPFHQNNLLLSPHSCAVTQLLRQVSNSCVLQNESCRTLSMSQACKPIRSFETEEMRVQSERDASVIDTAQ